MLPLCFVVKLSRPQFFQMQPTLGHLARKFTLNFCECTHRQNVNVFFGGFLFGHDGSESRQTDVIITTDTAPRYNFYNRDGSGKSFSPVDGTLGVVSIKSNLDRRELADCLSGLASIPACAPLTGRLLPLITIKNCDDWPYKVIYATDDVSSASLMLTLLEFYNINSNIPLGRRPNLINVAGKYAIFRVADGVGVWDSSTGSPDKVSVGQFVLTTRDPDLQALLCVIDGLQARAVASNHILYSYWQLINQVNRLPVPASD
jgi:hypothetical protein